MLTPDEQHFIDNLPVEVATKKVVIKPFSPQIQQTAKKIIYKIRNVIPDSDIRFMGASALGISGQNDIDIYVLAAEHDFSDYLPGMINHFGNPTSKSPGSIAWKFLKNNYDIELYLTDPESPTMVKQIKVFEALKNNQKLLKQYEQLKEDMDGSTFKDYQIQKYGFYHNILKDLNS